MRSLALAVAGLAALGSALPVVEPRQVLGKPTTIMIPGSSESPKKKIVPGIMVPPVPDKPEFQIGRRDAELTHVDDFAATFEALASRYTERSPNLASYLILQHMADILAASGHAPINIIWMGPATTTMSVGKRQDGVFGIGGSCEIDDLIGLLLTYSSLRSIYGDDPPTQIKNLRDAIYAALKYCDMDPETGGIVPDKPKPGAPIKPDPTTTGAPMEPDKTKQGAPMEPDKTRQGAPMEPDQTRQGAPMEPDQTRQGAPMEPDNAGEGAPMVPSS